MLFDSHSRLSRSYLALAAPQAFPYLHATRHPWPCLLFLLPLLAVYEFGVLHLGGSHPEALRNGADAWVRGWLGQLGLQQLFWAPLLLIAILLLWSSLRLADWPEDTISVWAGMAIESVLFALVLWALSRKLVPWLEGGRLAVDAATSKRTLAQIVTFVGAGIYEEVLFRLIGYSGLLLFLRLFRIPTVLAIFLAAAVSAIVFAAAHHVGVNGEPLRDYVVIFRALAGLYFALLFQFRGLAIAIGAHACYDVLVGIGVG